MVMGMLELKMAVWLKCHAFNVSAASPYIFVSFPTTSLSHDHAVTIEILTRHYSSDPCTFYYHLLVILSSRKHSLIYCYTHCKLHWIISKILNFII